MTTNINGSLCLEGLVKRVTSEDTPVPSSSLTEYGLPGPVGRLGLLSRSLTRSLPSVSPRLLFNDFTLTVPSLVVDGCCLRHEKCFR